MKLRELIKEYARWIFAIYMAVLILVIVLKLPTSLVTNTVRAWMNGDGMRRLQPQMMPFQTIIFYVKNVQTVYDWFFKNLAANILMFIPYGFLQPLCKKKPTTMRGTLLTGILLSIGIEIFQYIAAIGQCDVDDVILNAAGVCIGYGIYKLIYSPE